MIRGVSYSRPKAICLAGSLAIAVALGFALHHLETVESEGLLHAQQKRSALEEQISARSHCADADLKALRAEVAGLRERMAKPGAWERLMLQLGRGWGARAARTEERAGCIVQDVVLERRSPSTSDWPEIVSVAADIEKMQGARISSFEMRTSGDKQRRTVDLINILVSIRAQRPGMEPIQQ
jgi:hypothetical protein